MNLIEQLGGYEKAKIRLGSCDITLAYYQDLDSRLLEYRRENNFFEKGDKVVLRKHDCHAPDVYVVVCSKDYATLSNGESYDFALIKHASDKEIAQGYRDE